mmetsp:Transcript_27207/g.83831  ORF Transcript_27207/g.83831 Transcript_27207/m.83831 type:complete len:253 (+) Transcript_27207:239-997(+)
MVSRQQAALVVVALAAFAGAQNAKPASNGASVADAATDAVAAGRDHEDPASPQPRRLSSSGIAATDECREFFDAVVRCEADPENFTRRLQDSLVLTDDDDDDSVCGLADVTLADACGPNPKDACETERRDYTDCYYQARCGVGCPEPIAPPTCDGDRVWKECGTKCEATCEEPNPACVRMCVVGECQCPGRTVLVDADGDTCVAPESCVEPVPAQTAGQPSPQPSSRPNSDSATRNSAAAAGAAVILLVAGW